ncbi:MAG: DUF4189 domain-containing protein [Terracidiphilus sp.]
MTSRSVCAAVVSLLAALSARPAAAQNLWAAVAVSPSSENNGGGHAESSQAAADRIALQQCQKSGARDCKIVASISRGCVVLATPSVPVPNHFGFGSNPSRELAASNALAQCTNGGGKDCGVRIAQCSFDDPRWASPLPLPPVVLPGTVDPALVGLWKLNASNGIWVWQITANGTYSFHSAAPASPGNQPMHNGTFTTSNGKYTMHAINVVFDTQGTYTIEGSSKGTLQMNGSSGSSTWYRTRLDPDP